MLTFDNLVLQFVGRVGEPFGTWRSGERKIILRVGRCGNWTPELLFDICMHTINHEAIHGVIEKVCFPHFFGPNPPDYWGWPDDLPGRFDTEFAMIAGIDHIEPNREWWIAQIEHEFPAPWKKAREFYHKYVKDKQGLKVGVIKEKLRMARPQN